MPSIGPAALLVGDAENINVIPKTPCTFGCQANRGNFFQTIEDYNAIIYYARERLHRVRWQRYRYQRGRAPPTTAGTFLRTASIR